MITAKISTTPAATVTPVMKCVLSVNESSEDEVGIAVGKAVEKSFIFKYT